MARAKNSWFHFPNRFDPPALRLFCFPYAGGGASIYRGWDRELPASIEVVPVQPPGREGRLTEAPFRRMEALLDALEAEILPHTDRPFALFGYSLGSLVAYEIARRLGGGHGRWPRQLIVAARRAPHLPPTRDPIHHLPEAEFIDALRDLDGSPNEVLEHPELMELLMPLLRADFELVETYEPRRRPALDCPLSAFGGLADPDVAAEDLEAWRGYGAEPFRVRMFPGGHFFLQQEGRRQLLDALTRDLLPHAGR